MIVGRSSLAFVGLLALAALASPGRAKETVESCASILSARLASVELPPQTAEFANTAKTTLAKVQYETLKTSKEIRELTAKYPKDACDRLRGIVNGKIQVALAANKKCLKVAESNRDQVFERIKTDPKLAELLSAKELCYAFNPGEAELVDEPAIWV